MKKINYLLFTILSLVMALSHAYAEQPANGITLPFAEDFSGVESGEIPAGWTRDASNWGVHNSSNAGGEAPEMRFFMSPMVSGEFYLTTPAINTSGRDALEFSFRNYLNNDFSPPPHDLRVVALAGDNEYLIHEWVSPDDMAAHVFDMVLTAADHGVGAEDFRLAWVFDGPSYDLISWNIDDISLAEATTEEYLVTFMVKEDTPEEDPIEGAEITIDGMDPFQTDTGGQASIELSDGSYTAHVTKEDFEEQTIDFTIDGETKTINVFMEATDLPDDLVDEFPWIEDFETAWSGDPESPEGWKVVSGNFGSYWEHTDVTSNTGDYAARAYQGSSSNSQADEWLISPALNLDNPEATMLLFFGYSSYWPDGVRENMRIMIVDDQYDNVFELHVNAVLIDEISFTRSWEEYILSLEDYSGIKHIAFNYYIKGEDEAGPNRIYVDDVAVGTFDTFTLSMQDPVGEGAVSPESGDHNYTEGTEVELNAEAENNWSFEKWEVNGETYSYHADTVIHIHENISVQAFFVSEETFTLTMEEPEGNGSVLPEVGDHDYLSGEIVSISASPDLGWEFSHWEGNVAEEHNPETTITMDEDQTVKAHFSSADAVELPFMEDFSGVPEGEIPALWTRDVLNWGVSNTNHAGGEAPEMRFYMAPMASGEFYLTSPKINTSGNTSLVFFFNNYLNNYWIPSGYDLRVVSIADGEEFLIHEWESPSDIPAHEFQTILTAEDHGVGSEEFFLAWVFDGPSYDVNSWNFDNIFLVDESAIHTVTFNVMEDTNEEDPIEGAVITVNDQQATTDATGTAHIDLIGGMAYEATVFAQGYLTETVSFELEHQDKEMNVFMLDDIVEPYNLEIVTEGMDEGEALFMWNDYGSEYEFRYDDGYVDHQLGFTEGNLNSVLGAVHHYDAVVHEVSWFLTSEGGPHNYVKIWILGLDENGFPDRNNIIHTQENVTNTDEQWNTFAFPEPIDASNGFFVGLSYNGFLGIATDNGSGPPWEFSPGTHFAVQDITDANMDFSDINTWNFEMNFLLRAYGENNGEIQFGKQQPAFNQGPSPKAIPVETPFIVDSPNEDRSNKVFIGFNVYINGNMVEEEYPETEYLFTDLPAGDHTAGVQSVYTTGSSDIVEIDFEMQGEPVSYTVTFNVTDEEGEAIADATITFDGTQYDAGEYVFENVEPGNYDYIVSRDGYEDATGEVSVEDEDVLVEVILEDPVSVMDPSVAGLTIYPNPARNNLHIHADETIEEIRVLDVLGQLVYASRVEGNKYLLNVLGFDNGVYFIQIRTSVGFAIERLQISR